MNCKNFIENKFKTLNLIMKHKMRYYSESMEATPPPIMKISCPNKCCEMYKTLKEVNEPPMFLKDDGYATKAGIILIDRNKKILLSQSYNSFWGIPKGSKELNETFEDTSIRETYEETGIKINKNLLNNSELHIYFIYKKLYVFFLIFLQEETPKTLAPNFLYNESTGCGWINVNCLYKMIRKRHIKLNVVSKLILNTIVNQLGNNNSRCLIKRKN